MRLVLDPTEDAAHGEWLRRTPGAYEWWYFDALSDDGVWALACIWFLGNPFSPYYRLASLGRSPDPWEHNALFFALYREGRLHAYHFTKFPRSLICADEAQPATLRFGENNLSLHQGHYRLVLSDENANRRHLQADICFIAPVLETRLVPAGMDADTHFWLPAAPACRVNGRMILREVQNKGAEKIAFTGHGYHDHNWGRLPFGNEIREWYWLRASLGPERAVIAYHVTGNQGETQFLLFDHGRLCHYDANAQITQKRHHRSGFGTRYATELSVFSGDWQAQFRLMDRLDSAPFYLRAQVEATLIQAGQRECGQGIGEYFRPKMLSSPLAASAMKARIVER